MGHWTGYSLAVDTDCGCCLVPAECCDGVDVPSILYATVTGLTYLFGTNECDCLIGVTFPLRFQGSGYISDDPPCGLWWCGDYEVPCADVSQPQGRTISITLVCDDCPNSNFLWSAAVQKSPCTGGAGGTAAEGITVDCGPPFLASTTGVNLGAIALFCGGFAARVDTIDFTVTV